jgi:hypothetical protein
MSYIAMSSIVRHNDLNPIDSCTSLCSSFQHTCSHLQVLSKYSCITIVLASFQCDTTQYSLTHNWLVLCDSMCCNHIKHDILYFTVTSLICIQLVLSLTSQYGPWLDLHSGQFIRALNWLLGLTCFTHSHISIKKNITAHNSRN